MQSIPAGKVKPLWAVWSEWSMLTAQLRMHYQIGNKRLRQGHGGTEASKAPFSSLLDPTS